MLKRTFEGWTDQNHTIAVRKWDDGASATDIATYLGTSRNAVLGYMNRNRDDFPKKTEPTTARAEGKGDTLKWFRWTKDNIALAVKMYADGAAKSAIADAVGCSFHTAEKFFKENRDIFPLRKQIFVAKALRRQKEKSVEVDAPAVFVGDPSKWKSLSDLDAHDCRWPMEGAGAATMFCAGATVPGYSWCRCHYAMAFRAREAA